MTPADLPLAVALTHIRSFAASFLLPTFCHPFMLVTEEVLRLGLARFPAALPERDGEPGKWAALIPLPLHA